MNGFQAAQDWLPERRETMWAVKLHHRLASDEGGVQAEAGVAEMQESPRVYLH